MLSAADTSVTAAASILSAFVDDVAFLVPTDTILEKSIFDATEPVRRFLNDTNVHSYEAQPQGQEHKVFVPAWLLTESEAIPCRASLYRPNTKQGDPRIWFSKLHRHISAGNVLAILEHGGSLYLLNMSNPQTIAAIQNRTASPVVDLLEQVREDETLIANELLGKLRQIAARGPIQTAATGDTGIGRTLESLLGIEMNSRKTPDYRGIEIKSSRKRKSENRANLFAQVADWNQSTLKSSKAICEKYGYQRGSDRKLYCTISTLATNSQGLHFQIANGDTLLNEMHEDENGQQSPVATWPISVLTNRLKEKHKETFWIEADAIHVNGVEHFIYKSVIHTRNPIVGNFIPLLRTGEISMDHLIKIQPSGRTVEKGPLFKIRKKSIAILLPNEKKYELS